MPPRDAFDNAQAYYSTLFHELAHSTGHRKRLDRATLTNLQPFGSTNYSKEAEFERELIQDRVRSGIAAAKARGKRLGRPKATVDASKIAALRAQGLSWAAVSKRTGLSKGTAQRAFYSLPKNPSVGAPATG